MRNEEVMKSTIIFCLEFYLAFLESYSSLDVNALNWQSAKIAIGRCFGQDSFKLATWFVAALNCDLELNEFLHLNGLRKAVIKIFQLFPILL